MMGVVRSGSKAVLNRDQTVQPWEIEACVRSRRVVLQWARVEFFNPLNKIFEPPQRNLKHKDVSID